MSTRRLPFDPSSFSRTRPASECLAAPTKHLIIPVTYNLSTKSAQSSGSENIGPERPLPGLLVPGPVLSLSRITLENNGKNPAAAGSGERFREGKWRRRWDSNPRDPFGPTPLAGERLRPLGHVSDYAYNRASTGFTRQKFKRLMRHGTALQALEMAWKGTVWGSAPGHGVGTGVYLLLHSWCRSFTVQRSLLPRRDRCTRPSAFPPACSGVTRPTRRSVPASARRRGG